MTWPTSGSYKLFVGSPRSPATSQFSGRAQTQCVDVGLFVNRTKPRTNPLSCSVHLISHYLTPCIAIFLLTPKSGIITHTHIHICMYTYYG